MASRKGKSRSSEVHLLILGSLAALFGIYIFCCGFLLTRSELTNVTITTYRHAPEFKQIVLLLVDGLYTGLLPPLDKTSRMPFFRNLLYKNNSRHYFLAHFIADPPTTTMQRLKALLTGSMPTFIDAGSNFGGTELQEDNIIKQWALDGKKICFVGDSVWTELVSEGFLESLPLPAFNIKDLDTVDTAVKDYVLRESGADKCDVLIGHMLGIDHCGHTFGRSHPEMDRKLGELDDFLSRLLPKLRTSDVLIAFGDHGMTATGDHGGESDAEVDAAFFAYSPRGFPRAPQTGIAAEAPLPSVEQINLVPTLAALTSTSIPFSNLGVVLTQLLKSNITSSVNENFKQMYAYATEYRNRFGLIKIPDEMEQRMKQNPRFPCSSSSLEECISSMQTLRSTFRTHWTRMDVWRIALGFTLTLLSLLTFLCLDIDGSINLELLCLGATAVSILLAFVHLTALAFIPLILPFCRLGTNWIKRILRTANWDSMVAAVILAIMALTASSNSFVVQEARVLTYLLQTMLILTGICTIGSTKLHRWYIFTPLILCICLLWIGRYLEVCREESPGTSTCVVMGDTTNDAFNPRNSSLASFLLTRLSALSGHSLGRFAGPRLLMATAGVSSILFGHRYLLTSWGNNLLGEGVIGFLLNVTAPIGGVLLPLIWLFDILSAVFHGGAESLRKFEYLQPHATIRFNFARTVFAIGGVLFAILIYHPLLVTAGIGNSVNGKGKEVYLSGIATAYTSWILTTLVIAPLLPLLVLLGDVYVWPCIGLLFCLIVPPLYLLQRPQSSLSRKKVTKDRSLQAKVISLLDQSTKWAPVIYACLLSELGFYCLGHQPTFPAISWDAAFSIIEGEGVTSSTVLPAVLILSHTFASQIIVTAALPLLVLLPLHMATKGSITLSETLLMLIHSETCSNALRASFNRLFRRYLIAHFTLFTGHLLCAFVLCRHLMVWQIFAPRLVFSLCGLGVVCVTALIVYSLLIHRLHAAVVKLRKQVFNIAT
ncbi:hypothetical protein ACTXT7_008363 [Hymenolepis weldensis]